MIFEQFAQPKKFKLFVEPFTYFKGYSPEHSIEKVIPDGSINLIFELDGFVRNVFDNETLEPKFEYSKVWLSGVQRNFISISTHKDSEMFVIRFKPGGAFPFADKPISEFTDKVIPAEEIFGDEIFEFRTDLLKATEPEKKKEIGFKWLESKFNESRKLKPEISDSIGKIVSDPQFQRNNLQQLVEESGFSQKQFISLFKNYVGITPKYFQRIVRFSEILLKIQNEQKLSWAEISLDCGFYDQAHFIKEFQHFCGYNPEAHLDKPLTDERVNFFPVE